MRKGTIHSIQYVRGIAALFVVLFHFRYILNGVYSQQDLGNLLFRWGEIGVDAFFIISGFIICYATENDRSKLSFVIKRIFRIYPVYLLFLSAFILLLFLSGKNISIQNIINGVLISPQKYSDGAPFYGYSFLVVAWSLFYEIAFYFIFMISMFFSHKYRVYICSFIIFISTISLQLYFNGEFLLGAKGGTNKEGLGVINILSSSMMLIFIIGMLMYDFIKNYGELISNKINCTLILLLSSTLFIYCYLTGFNSWHGVDRAVVFIAPLIISLILFEIKNKNKKNIKWISFLGDISYSLYLCHLIVVLFYNNFGGSFFSASSGLSRFFILVTTSIFISYFSYKYIEKPSAIMCRRIIEILKKK